MLGPARDFVYFSVIKAVYGGKGMSHGKSRRGPRRRVVALADSIVLVTVALGPARHQRWAESMSNIDENATAEAAAR